MTREKQTVRVLKFLLTGNKISTWTAIFRLRITRLPARMLDLKKLGIKFEKKMFSGEGKRYMQYWIKKETCEAYRKHKLLQG